LKKGDHDWTAYPRVDVRYHYARVPLKGVRMLDSAYRLWVSERPDAKAFYKQMSDAFADGGRLDVTGFKV